MRARHAPCTPPPGKFTYDPAGLACKYSDSGASMNDSNNGRSPMSMLGMIQRTHDGILILSGAVNVICADAGAIYLQLPLSYEDFLPAITPSDEKIRARPPGRLAMK